MERVRANGTPTGNGQDAPLHTGAIHFRHVRQTNRSDQSCTNKRRYWFVVRMCVSHVTISAELPSDPDSLREAYNSLVKTTLSASVSNATSLTSFPSYRYPGCATTLSIDTSTGVTPSATSPSKSKSPKRTSRLESTEKKSAARTIRRRDGTVRDDGGRADIHVRREAFGQTDQTVGCRYHVPARYQRARALPAERRRPVPVLLVSDGRDPRPGA